MLTALLLSLSPVVQDFPHVEVHSGEAFEFAGELGEEFARFVLPTVTTDERAARLIPGTRGARVRIASPAGVRTLVKSIELRALKHADREHVRQDDGSPIIFSEPRMPAFVRREADGRNRLPSLARCDLVSVSEETLLVAAAEDDTDWLVMIAEEGSSGAIWIDGARAGFAAHPTNPAAVCRGGAVKLQLTSGARLDQLYHTTPRRPEELEYEPCAQRRAWRYAESSARQVRRMGRGPLQSLASTEGVEAQPFELTLPLELGPGEVVEVRFEAPSAPEQGQAHTYLLDVWSQHEVAAEAVEAAAAVKPRRSFFVDRFRAAGLDAVHFEGPHDQRDIRPTMGPGAAWGDVDGDGLQDLLLVQGGGREGCEPVLNRLYKNLGGHFEELSAFDAGAGMGALFFDLEGDGDLDLYVANYGADRLYTNDGKGAFEDVSEAHGVGGELWSAGVCAGDTDGDGDLELYVTSYLNYDPALMPPVEKLPGMRREDPVEMLPFAFPGERNTFYDNQDGKLVDVTEAKGLFDVQGRGMQAVFWDFDRDADLDLYIANDVSFNVLLRNDGAGNFEDISFQTGMDDPRGGMGVALGDVDGDLDDDLFLTNWQLEANALYLNNHVANAARKAHVGTFQDGTVRSRLGPAGVGVTSWGAVLFDADNDGDLDLFIPNGYTSPDYESTGICVGQPNQFFLNDGEGRFSDASFEAGPDVTAELASRTAAVCDYDRDGRLDLLVTTNNGPYQLLHNEFPDAGHWLGVRLHGSGKNSFAIGARVVVEAGELELTRTLTAGEGYLAGNAAELHFGLADNTSIRKLSVHWPSGTTTTHEVANVDAWIRIEE